MKKQIQKVHGVVNGFVNLLWNAIAVSTAVALTALFFQVMMRYLFNHPVYGVDEAVTAIIIWTMSLGFVVIYWNNENAVIEFIVSKCPHVVRFIINYITELIVLVMGAVMVPTGINLFKIQAKQISLGGLPFPKAYYYALPVTVMGALLAVLAAFRIIEYTITRDDALFGKGSGEESVNID